MAEKFKVTDCFFSRKGPPPRQEGAGGGNQRSLFSALYRFFQRFFGFLAKKRFFSAFSLFFGAFSYVFRGSERFFPYLPGFDQHPNPGTEGRDGCLKSSKYVALVPKLVQTQQNFIQIAHFLHKLRLLGKIGYIPAHLGTFGSFWPRNPWFMLPRKDLCIFARFSRSREKRFFSAYFSAFLALFSAFFSAFWGVRFSAYFPLALSNRTGD